MAVEAQSDKLSGNSHRMFNFESRMYLLCLSLWCPHFSLYRNNSSFCLFSSFKHSTSCSAIKMLKIFQPPFSCKLLQPSTFTAFLPFQFFKILIFLLFQPHTVSVMFTWRNSSDIKLFTFSSSVGPLTL